jgi:dGTPase
MRDAGGFEGNAQTLRILTTLGEYTRNFGADLTRRSLLGVLKYPVLWSQARNAHIRPALSPSPTTIAVLDRSSCKPPKACYDGDAEVLEWILDACSPDDSERFRAIAPSVDRHGKALHKSFDCSVMNLADDIAYGVHDLEDAIALGLISENSFYSALSPVARELISDSLASHPLVDVGAYDAFVTSLFSDAGARKRAIGRLVHVLLRGVEIAADPSFDEPLLANYVHLTDEPRRLLEALQALVVAEVINSAKVQQLEFKGERMVVAVFEAIISEPDRLLPELIRREFDASKNPHRVLCDHISAMTDAALLKTYDRLFSPRMGSVFDRL